MVEILVLGISSLLNLLLGLFIYIKNPRSATNRLFLMLIGGFVAWSVVSYYSLHPVYFSQLVWVRLVLFCAAFLCLSVYLTFAVFPSNEFTGDSFRRKLFIIATGLVMALTLTPYVFKPDSLGEPVPNFAMVFFVALVALLLLSGVINILAKHKKSTGKERDQLRFVLFGIVATFSLILITNLLFVVVFQVNELVSLGPAFTLIFTGSMGYAIIRHRLFDIKAVVARSVAYTLVLGTLALIYGLVLFGVVNTIFRGSENEYIRQVLSVILIVPVLLSFQTAKKYFDRITEKFFYKDAYDAQTFIDELNKTLVSNSDTEALLKMSCQLIEDRIKAEFVSFYVRDTSYFKSRIVGDYKSKLDEDDSTKLHDLLPRTHRKILDVEADPQNEAEEKAFVLLKANNIEVLVRIVSTLEYEVDGVGYLLLGQKRSGNPYSSQDLRVLEIIGNELEIAVENSLRFEEIEQFNVTLQKKIEDATKELKKNNDKLKALDEAKDEFVSMASHQLRTPLTSIKGYISMVLEGDAGKISDTQRQMLGQALFSSQRMVYLISDLLNVSRLKTGKFLIEPKPVCLPDLVESEVNQLLEGAKAKNIKLTFDKPKKFSKIMLDDMKIRQVVMNFVDNAIYYTSSGGKIAVSLKETSKSVELRVKDTGIGVPKEQVHKLFTKFYRADNARKARPDGTGLGLFMAKKVIIAQGGSIIIESVENKGSTFGFSFPKARLLVEDDKAEDDKKETSKPK